MKTWKELGVLKVECCIPSVVNKSETTDRQSVNRKGTKELNAFLKKLGDDIITHFL